MILHTRVQKSKKRKVPKSVQAQHDAWLSSVQNMSTGFSRKNYSKSVTTKTVLPLVTKPYQRETPHIPSRNPHDMSPCVKKEQNKYTGTNMLGIGTLHKSNAVPVFNSEEAVEMAKMRR